MRIVRFLSIIYVFVMNEEIEYFSSFFFKCVGSIQIGKTILLAVCFTTCGVCSALSVNCVGEMYLGVQMEFCLDGSVFRVYHTRA